MTSQKTRASAHIHQQYWRQLMRNQEIQDLICAEESGANKDISFPAADRNPGYMEWCLFRQQVKTILLAGISPEWLFDIAGSLNTATHGPLGLAALSAENIKQAVQIIATHTQSRQTVVNVTLDKTSNNSTLIFTPNVETDEIYYLFENVTQLVIVQIFTSMSAPPSKDSLKIYCGGDSPYIRAALDRIGNFACKFDWPESKIVLGNDYLKCFSDYADQSTCEANLLKCYKDKIQSLKDDRSLEEKIRSLFNDFVAIRQLELNNQLPASPAPTVDSTAQALHMSTRTLHRKLQESEQSFKELWQNYKQQQAESLLSEDNRTIAEIAELLGYQDTANFVRAFKQWTDVPPAQWRNEKKTVNR